MRPGIDEYFISMAKLVALRATCLRRAVGCVLVNGRNHVIATGYNGRPAGWAHCNRTAADIAVSGDPLDAYPYACQGAFEKQGNGLDRCEAIHAEMNALLQCHDVYEIATCYSTTAPCITCTKLLLNTSCWRIVFSEPYAHDEASRELWTKKTVQPRQWDFFKKG
jgi:dCMP deaminase